MKAELDLPTILVQLGKSLCMNRDVKLRWESRDFIGTIRLYQGVGVASLSCCSVSSAIKQSTIHSQALFGFSVRFNVVKGSHFLFLSIFLFKISIN